MEADASLKALRRLRHHLTLLAGPIEDEGDVSSLSLQYTAGEDDPNSYKSVSLGGVSLEVVQPLYPELVPSMNPAEPYGIQLDVPEVLRHLKWMFQKAKLGQDMFLLGPPGPLRRWIAFRFCQITKREVEYLALTRDTTESDLKQRREIQGGSVRYIDQVAVRAAIHGRILVLEGLEKCERNVLPVLNNLLENREMHLEDGRFLVSPKRFAQIQKTHTPEQIKALGLVPVHPRFQVIALGLPVPRFEGNPLDPPLRSRFQARNVNALASDAQLAIIRHMYPKVDPAIVSKIVSFAEALNRMQQLTSAGVQSQDDSLHIARMLALPPTAAVDAARLLGRFPGTDIRDILTRVYPFEARPDETEVVAIRSALASLGLLLPVDVGAAPASTALENSTELTGFDIQETRIEAVPGVHPFVETDESSSTLAALSQDDDVGFDICIIGEQGSGKSRLVQRFASSRHRGWRTMQMYRDMTARDLLQRRATDEKGDTVWINSPLVTAAIQGDICVLDGVHRLGPGTLSVLQQLVHDRQAQLCDGRLLTGVASQSAHNNVVVIHPKFRIAALATPPTKIGRGNWLSSEISAMFHFHLLRDVSVSHKLAILDRLFPQMRIASVAASKTPSSPSMSTNLMQYAVTSLIKFLRILENARKKGMAPAASAKAAPVAGGDSGSELPKVSLRQLIRVCKRASLFPEDLAEALEDTLLLKFLPTAVRDVIVQMLEHSGIQALQHQQDKLYSENLDQLRIKVTETTVFIGTESSAIPAVTMKRNVPKNAALIPRITFFEIPNHVRLLREMLKDMVLGEPILLIGNQGVGKNILADCLLEMLRIEREYIQLHRDTTVQTLTLSPSIQNGVIVWEDSPLIRAVVHGRTLVIDEADKAPLEVVCVLKGLIEDGEMLLADGRRIMHPTRLAAQEGKSENVIPIHSNFKMIVLANRPGYPFLGNNFFRECGDCFAVHVVNNPDAESELRLLKSYAPSVDLEILQRLINLFGDLREMVDRGVLTYPYSLRELVNISKHIQAFPGDSLAQAIDNVFHFDSYDMQLREHLAQVFHRHGVPLAAGDLFRFEVQLAEPRALPEPVATSVWQMGNPAAHADDEIKSSLTLVPLVEKGRIKFEPKQWLPVRSRIQGRIQTFTEERFQWRLDVAGHTESVAVTPDGQICVLTSQPLQLIVYKPPYTQFRVISIGDHLTAFIKTPESSSILASHAPTLAALQDNTIILFVAAFKMLIKIDLAANVLVPYELDLDPEEKNAPSFSVFGNKIHINNNLKRTLQREHRTGPSAYDLKMIDSLALSHNRIVFCRNLGNEIVVLDMSKNTQSVLRMTAAIFGLFPLDGDSFLVRSRNETWFIVKLVAAKFLAHIVPIDVKVDQQIRSLPSGNGVLLHNFASAVHEAPTTVLNSSFTYTQVMDAQLLGLEGAARVLSFLRPSAKRSETSAPLKERPAEREGQVVQSLALPKSKQLLNLCFVPPFELDIDLDPRLRKTMREEADMNAHYVLELVDLKTRQLRRVRMTAREVAKKTILDIATNQQSVWTQMNVAKVISIREMPNGDVLVLHDDGMMSIWEVDPSSIQGQLNRWKSLMGLNPAGEGAKGMDMQEKDRLRLTFEYDDGAKSSKELKVGKVDPTGKGHAGGNTFAGGSGGAGTAGTGGRSGPFRLSDGNDVYQVSQAEKDQVSREVTAAAREMAKKALAEKLAAINMSEREAFNYEQMMNAIGQDIRQLRAVLEAAQAKSRERTWLKLETQGELDENRLVDGITGERNVYKRRGRENPYHGMMQEKPKRLRFVMDISASMYRFNNEDKRLNRLLEVTLMIMEALQGFEWKYQYSIVGHSGDSAEILLVDYGKPPKNAKERMKILEKMVAHSQTSGSGDNTTKATDLAVRDVVKEDSDEYFVFVFSDANLSRYGIDPATISTKLVADPRVNAFIVFIATFADEAARIKAEMPLGKAHVCLDTSALPFTFKQIFMSTATGDV